MGVEITEMKNLKGVFIDKKKRLYTVNFNPGNNVYGEKLVREKGIEYRQWDVLRSKLGAGIKKGISQTGIKPGSVVLYLGASSGTTPSHVSDIVGKDGFVYALDFSPRMVRDLVFMCKGRDNIIPMLEDGNHPENYIDKISEVDVVFQDIAQKIQVQIFLRNVNQFLKKGGFGILAVKARSVDVTKKPKDIFKMVRRELESKLTIVDYRELDPFEKDHCVFVVKKK